MLIEAGIGDSYGSRFEGCDADYTSRQNNLSYFPDERHFQEHPEDVMPSLVRSAHYSDDVQMTLAIAEAMLDDYEPWTVESLADRFVEVFKRDERRGYTTYFLNVLMNSDNGKELLCRIGRKSTKSGAFMRATPLGLYEDFNLLIERAELQASVTHDSWVGKNSAIGAALMVHYFYHDLGPKNELSGWMRDVHFGDSIMTPHAEEVEGEILECWSPSDKRRVGVHGWDCLHAAIYAVERSSSLSEVLTTCVGYGGDVDTVATVAMAAASWSTEIKQALPRRLYDDLENKTYGRDYLGGLDKKLVEKFPWTGIRGIQTEPPLTPEPEEL